MKTRTFSPHHDSLEEIVVRFGFARDCLKIVDSIADYCAGIGHPHLESHKNRIAKCITAPDGTPTFLLWDHAEPSDVMTILMVHNFPADDIQLLSAPSAFAKHQLLHEIAHIVRQGFHAGMAHNRMEEDCDRWAFEQLRKPNQVLQPTAPNGRGPS